MAETKLGNEEMLVLLAVSAEEIRALKDRNNLLSVALDAERGKTNFLKGQIEDLETKCGRLVRNLNDAIQEMLRRGNLAINPALGIDPEKFLAGNQSADIEIVGIWPTNDSLELRLKIAGKEDVVFLVQETDEMRRQAEDAANYAATKNILLKTVMDWIESGAIKPQDNAGNPLSPETVSAMRIGISDPPVEMTNDGVSIMVKVGGNKKWVRIAPATPI
jgi:hypothetical protein